MSVRGGIIVTGTEVLTGRITDRNGPWIERLEEQGVDVAHIITVGIARTTSRRRCASWRPRGWR